MGGWATCFTCRTSSTSKSSDDLNISSANFAAMDNEGQLSRVTSHVLITTGVTVAAGALGAGEGVYKGSVVTGGVAAAVRQQRWWWWWWCGESDRWCRRRRRRRE